MTTLLVADLKQNRLRVITLWRMAPMSQFIEEGPKQRTGTLDLLATARRCDCWMLDKGTCEHVSHVRKVTLLPL
jgi:hypothetical protein